MLSWPDALCEALARGGRHVARYDLRDSGASTTVDPAAPKHTLRDLAADAAALAREVDDRPTHLPGIGVGGIVAQVAALDHPDAFSALTLAATRPIAPGPVDGDLPDHDPQTMARLFSRPMPEWSDRAAVAAFAAAGAEILGNDSAPARTTAARIWDRTRGTDPAVQIANHMAFIGGGGFAVVNVPDEETLSQIVIEMPFSWVSDVNVRPFVDGGSPASTSCSKRSPQ
jgi:pimeloyl-ACP methyl ester carboxylesterase